MIYRAKQVIVLQSPLKIFSLQNKVLCSPKFFLHTNMTVQRGWLEVDILLGSWAIQNVPKLTEAELGKQFDFSQYFASLPLHR
jgi:hypothetical protein